jgi:hypothetical protein
MRKYSRIVLAALLILAIAVTLSYRSNRHIDAKPVSAGNSTPQKNQPKQRAAHAAPRVRGTDLRLIADSPTSAAAAWMEHADAAIAAKRARRFGVDVATMAALPPAEAWAKLTQLARDGDVAATAAALVLASECKRLLEQRESPLKPSHYIEHATRNLPQEWIDFITAIDIQQNARVAARTDNCTGVGGMLDFAQMAIDRFMRPDDPQAQLWEAAQMEDDKDAIPLMRNIADRLGTEEARRELGVRLISSKNAAESAEGLAILESLAESDELADMTLIYCFRSGCGSVTPDPAIAIIWMEDAAGLGDPIGGQALQNEFVTSGNNVEAWAWAMYGLELATAGCLESNEPSPTWVLQDARRAFDLDHLLDATQRTQAQAILQTIRQRWESLAMTNQGCAL